MTTAPALEDDRAFFTDGRPYLTTRQAALYVGYAPTAGRLARDDREMWKFYKWAALRHVHPQPGRSVYRRADLDAAIQRRPVAANDASLETMRRLAQSDVADRRRQARLALTRRKDQP